MSTNSNNPYGTNISLGNCYPTSPNALGGGYVGSHLSGMQAINQIQPAQMPYSLPMARNALADQCALAVYERRVSLKEAAKEMPGDYDLNRKLLGDVFLMSPVYMTLEQAASLAFALHEEVGAFLNICDQVGAIIPSGR